MTQKTLLSCLALAAAGCEPSSIALTLPPNVERAAIVIGGDSISPVTGLLHADRAHEITVERSDGEIWVLGWDRAALEPSQPVPLEDAPSLRVARACEETLAPPTFAASIEDRSSAVLAEVRPAWTSSLTADWLVDRCDATRPVAFADLRCDSGGCDARASRIGCTSLFDFRGCGPGPLPARAGKDGSLCVDPANLPPSCTTSSPGGILTVTCGGCAVELHPPATLEADLQRVRIVEGPRLEATGSRRGFNAGRSLAGYTGDLHVRGDELLVVSFDGALVGESCVGARSSRLHFFDLESLSPTRSATVSGCVQSITPEGGGAGWIAATQIDAGAGVAIEIVRLDERGAITATIARLSETAGAFRAMGLVARGDRLIAVLSHELPGGDEEIQLVALSRAGALERRDVIPDGKASGMTVLRDGRIAVSDEGRDALVLVDPVSLDHTTISLIGVGDRLGAVLEDPSTPDQVLIASLSGTPGVNVIAGASAVGVANPYETFGEPMTLERDPRREGMVLAGLAVPVGSDESWNAALARLDPKGPRFLPGQIALGYGVVGRMRVDARGRVLALLPWAGELVRVDLR